MAGDERKKSRTLEVYQRLMIPKMTSLHAVYEDDLKANILPMHLG